MKKAYNCPSVRTITLNIESALMAASIQIGVDTETELGGSEAWTQKRGGWNAEDWSENME